MSLIYDTASGNVTDTRGSVLFSAAPKICFSFPGDEVYALPRRDFCPFSQREEDAVPEVARSGEGLSFTFKKKEGTDGYGAVLPFDFMGKRDGSGSERYLLNSIRRDETAGVFYAYLCRRDGKNILLCAKNTAGFRIDYTDYDFGHYFEAVRLYAALPEGTGAGKGYDSLTLSLFPVADFDSCLKIMADYFDLPFISADALCGKTGETLKIKAFGECDTLETEFDNCRKATPFTGEYVIGNEGVAKLVPVKNGRKSVFVTVLGISDIVEMYRRVMNAFSFETLSHVDGNLCEHQCWISAMLRFLVKYRDRVTAEEKADWESKIKKGLFPVTAENPGDFIIDRTILPFDYDGYSKYHIYSTRIQEQFFGVTIMLDACRYFGEEKYLRYAAGAMDCLLREHFENGMLYRAFGNEKSDVTTVCCPMIPLCDMANFLRERDPARSERYFAAAREMADFLVRRGFDFPTEGESGADTFKAEDGSVSCTALALLYYVKNAEYNEKYLSFAREILDLHSSAWVINTPLCETKGSTLRWWETLWEGDSDGPAVCAGHAWTVWRAEADMLYYLLTRDGEYLTRAKNGFASNLSKIDPDGTSYAVNLIDEICGGGFDRLPVRFETTPRKPKTPDCGLSNYLWVRLSEYISEL